MNNSVHQSLAKIRKLESKEILDEGALGTIGKKVIPGAGVAFGALDTAKRLKAGDKIGAGIAGTTAGLSAVPVIGTAAALLGTGAQAAWDKYKTGSWFPDDDEIAAGAAQGATQTAAAPAPKVPPGGDPKVFALQNKLIAKGAKIQADGKMGPATQAAMKQFPDVKMVEDNKENEMSESQRIAELMSRLAQLEQTQTQVADEGIADLAKGAWQGMKNIGSAFKAGVADPAGAKALAPAATKAGEKAALATGAAVARNPGKVAAGAAGAGVLGTAATMGGAATKPADPAKPAAPAKKPATGAGTSPAAAAGLSPQEEQELALLAADMAKLKGQNSELDALIDRHLKLRPDAGTIANPE